MTVLFPSWLFGYAGPRDLSDPPLKVPQNSLPLVALQYYSTPGITPPSARVDPKLKLQPRRPPRLWEWWKYGVFVAVKATEVTTEIIVHHVRGPRRKTWGIEMTIVTSLVRGTARHSALVEINTIRTLMGLAGLVPLPSDALVTPVTFRVKKRNLRGLLAEFDAKEDGGRELSGEWVVGRRTWQRLQAEWKAARSNSSSPKNGPPGRKERVILYIHGGAYYLSSAAAQRLISIPLSKYTDARVFAIDYRLAPETVFPGPLHDVVSAYFRLIDDLCLPPENIIICGDSAGGALSLALLMYLRDNDYPLPSGAVLMSPWVDLTMSCESWDSNSEYDVVPFPTADNHMNPIGLYLGDHTERYITHPYASPLFGDFTGLPPLLIQAGDAEVLRDEITLLAHKATLAGVPVRHELYEDAIHVFQAYPFLVATRRSFMSMRDFVRNILPQYQASSPKMLGSSAEKELEQEIDNDNAKVVRGDGVVATADKKADRKTLGVGADIIESDGEEGKNSYPSWVRPKHWYLGPEDLASADSKALASESLPTKSDGSLRRIKSAISLVLPNSTNQELQRQSSQALLSPQKKQENMLLDDILSSISSPPPSPSIRRKQLNASHRDLTSLVDNWAHSGPANQTLLFKRETTCT
jgi:acetyl esterase/lipase